MIIDHPIFTEVLLPFLLVFVLIFAILQKTKVLGDGKKQIDALVSLAIGLILIGFKTPREFIVNLMPWLAVGAAVILVFLILYGFVAGDLSGDKIPKWMKITFGILAGVFTLGVVIYVGGFWDNISRYFSGGDSIWMELVLLIIIIVAILIAVLGDKKKE